jgi:hypothetical protein
MKGMFQSKIPNKIHITKRKTSKKSLYSSEHVMMVAYRRLSLETVYV